MRNGKRGRYTLEFKQEAVRLVESGQSIAATARSLGVVEQTLSNWVRAGRAGTLKEVSGKAGVMPEQMEISRLRAELARVKMERDILGKATAYFGGWPTLSSVECIASWNADEMNCCALPFRAFSSAEGGVFPRSRSSTRDED